VKTTKSGIWCRIPVRLRRRGTFEKEYASLMGDPLLRAHRLGDSKPSYLRGSLESAPGDEVITLAVHRSRDHRLPSLVRTRPSPCWRTSTRLLTSSPDDVETGSPKHPGHHAVHMMGSPPTWNGSWPLPAKHKLA